MRVKSLKARQVFLTNSKKTIEVELETSKGRVKASVPMGTSRGKYEAVWIDAEKAVNIFKIIKPKFLGDFEDQEEVDDMLREIDSTPNFKEIGGNLALAISSAFLKAFAMEEGKEVFEFLRERYKFYNSFPKPVCNVAGGWGKKDVQEILLLPHQQKSFFSSIERISEAYFEVKIALEKKDPKFRGGKNLESGWISSLPLEELLSTILPISRKFLLLMGVDLAASNLWNGRRYYLPISKKIFTPLEYFRYISTITQKFSLHYIEDPFHEDDFTSFSLLTHTFPKRLVVGDDLYATNYERVKLGLEKGASNAMIIKPNQVGTISDVIKVVELAKKNGMKTVFSHRSGESDDVLICHLAVGLGADYVKFGISGERVTKLNEMIRIEEKIISSS